MTTKARADTTTTAADVKADAAAEAKPAEAKPARRPGECVVDDGTPHMGRATPGARICSAHAMWYRADGTPRGQ